MKGVLVYLVHRWTEWIGWTGVDRNARMLGGAGHSALEGGEVGGDAVDVEVIEKLQVSLY